MTDVGSLLAIAVKGVPRGVSEEVLSQYFFSQGGEIKNLKIEGEKAIVEFEDTSVIPKVLAVEHKIGRHVITVSSLSEQASPEVDGLASGQKAKRVVLKGVSAASPQEFQQYLGKLVTGVQCTSVTYTIDHTVAVFDNAIDIHTLENILKNSLFCDKQQPLSISVLEPPKCVLISGLPLDTPEFALKLYVEKLGAEAKYIKFLPPNKAIVEFESWDGCRIVTQVPDHKLGDVPVSIVEYYPHLKFSQEANFEAIENTTSNSVQKVVKYEPHEWKVLSFFPHKLQEVQHIAFSHNVTFNFPSATHLSSAVNVIGNSSEVAVVVRALEGLKTTLHTSSVTLEYSPGMWSALSSLEDKIRLLEQESKVAICFNVDDWHTTGIDVQNQVAFTASISEGCLFEVCVGNYAKHSPADAIITILVCEVDNQCLKPLTKCGGEKVYEDVQNRIRELSSYELPQVFETKPHNLKVSKLIHCLVPKWSGQGGRENSALQEALTHALASCIVLNVVITPATAYPANYPPEVAAEAVLNAVKKIAEKVQIPNMQIEIYTVDMDEAQLIMNYFQQCSLKIHRKNFNPQQVNKRSNPPVSVKKIASALPTFVSIIKGNILQQKVDAYVNSTNPDLDLSRGCLSNQILKHAGGELQSECSKYAPLKFGQVAVTPVKKLQCKTLLHVTLPSYKSAGSEKVLKSTMKNLLKVCLENGISSIAIPSLGTGNLGYPHYVVATILLRELILFNKEHPSRITSTFVLAENAVYEGFIKVYAQNLCENGSEKVEKRSRNTEVYKSVSSTRLYVKHGKLEDEVVDVIVNPTTHDICLSSNPVSYAIGKMAGPALQIACTQLSDLIVDQKTNILTKASGQLRSKKVLHVYTPIKEESHQAAHGVRPIIFSVVLEALKTVEQNGLKSVAFPLLGFGYCIDDRAIPMLEAALKFGESSPQYLSEIRVTTESQQHYKELFACYSKKKAQYCDFSESLATKDKENEFLEVQPTCRIVQSCKLQFLQPWHISDLTTLNGCSLILTTCSTTLMKCDLIIQEVKRMLNEQIYTEIIHEEEISQLIHSEFTFIENIIGEFGITVNIDKEQRQIILSGEESKVKQAQSEVSKLLTTLQRAITTFKHYEWRRTNENLSLQYPEEISIRLEMEHSKENCLLELHSSDIDAVVDLANMLEMCKVSGRTFNIHRVKRHDHIEFPDTWEPQPIEHGQEKTCHMFTVSVDSNEYQRVLKEFKATMYGMDYKIIGLERIQNPNEYVKHHSFLQVLRNKYGGQVVQKHLFHGTVVKSVDAIAHQGFNRIFAADANAAVFGKGVYFATCANYSAQEKYAAPDGHRYQKMFICNVIIGRFTKGDTTMKIAPPLDSTKNEHLLFDTLVNNTAKPTIYVTMSDSQAYPEYLVTFRSKQK